MVRVEGRWVLVFSRLADQIPGAAPGSGGVGTAPGWKSLRVLNRLSTGLSKPDGQHLV
jgi:hypothetical protein